MGNALMVWIVPFTFIPGVAGLIVISIKNRTDSRGHML